MTRPLASLALVVVLLLGASAWLGQGGDTPAGQPPLRALSRLDELKLSFNDARDRIRLIVSLAPTCPYCLKGASGLNRLLDARAADDIAVFVVWQPVLSTDWGLPGTRVLHRLAHGNVRQYWDADRAVADDLRRTFQTPDRGPSCCDQNGVWWDFIAAFPPGGEWRDRWPEPALLDGTLDDVLPELERWLAGRRPVPNRTGEL